MSDVLTISTDGLRWWGFSAAVIGLPDAARAVWAAFRSMAEDVKLGIWAALGLLFFFCFLAVAGLSIPLSSRVSWLSPDGVPYQIIVFVFWCFAATGGWSFNVSRSPGEDHRAPGKRLMLVSGAILFFLMQGAAFLTHVA